MNANTEDWLTAITQTTKNITAANQSVSTSQKYIIKANTSSLDLADDFHYKWSGQFIAC